MALRLTAIPLYLFVTLKRSTSNSLRALGEQVSGSQGDVMSTSTSARARVVDPAADARTSGGPAAQTLARAPVELVVQRLDRHPTPTPNWNSRSWTAVTLVPADRIRPHALADAIGRQRVATSRRLQPEASSPVTHVTPAATARIASLAPVPLPPVAIADNAGAGDNHRTDISRIGLQTAAIDWSLVPLRPHAHAAPAELAERDAAATMRAAPSRTRDDEQNIYQVVQEYERAYERLDVNAARAIWPSVDARALARAFDGLKEQTLEFSKCRVAVATGEATVVCGGRASYVTRVGHQSARTEPREWTFRLRNIDANWLIAKAEVQ